MDRTVGSIGSLKGYGGYLTYYSIMSQPYLNERTGRKTVLMYNITEKGTEELDDDFLDMLEGIPLLGQSDV